MSTLNVKETMNEVYDGVLITLGIVGISWGSKKIFKMKTVEDVKNLEDVARLGATTAASVVLVDWMKANKWVPTNPFSKQ